MKISKFHLLLSFFLISATIFAQNSENLVEEINISKTSTFINEAYSSIEAKNILNDTNHFNSIKKNLKRLRIVEATEAHVSQFQKLSSISKSKYPYLDNFNPSEFNPLLFNFDYSFSNKKIAYQVDGTKYYIIILDYKK